MGPDDVEPNLRQTSYEIGKPVDLFLIHHPYAMSYQRMDFIDSIDYLETWNALVKVYKEYNVNNPKRIRDRKGIAMHLRTATLI